MVDISNKIRDFRLYGDRIAFDYHYDETSNTAFIMMTISLGELKEMVRVIEEKMKND